MTNGTRIGDFRLDGVLGEGGMGTVWNAVHVESGQPVAIKTLRDEGADEDTRAAFETEIRTIARCRHPNVIRILDFGHGSSGRWFAMERIDGGDLRHQPPNSWNELRAVVVDVLRGLAHAHGRGITHRDLKPENILLGDRTVVTDFGLAHRLASSARTHAQIYSSAGTPSYMAPEQILGEWRNFGPWTDLYALGCMVFELSTGRPPHDGTHVLDILRSHLEGEPARFVPRFDTPAGLRDWIDSLMVKSPHMRLATAAEALSSLPPPLGPSPQPEQPSGAPITTTVLAETLDAPTVVEALETLRLAAFDAPVATATSQHRADVVIPTEAPKPAPMPRGLDWQSSRVFSIRPPIFDALTPFKEVMWDVLHQAAQRHDARVILLEGPDGAGTAPLAWWLSEQAHEHAAARVFRAAFAAGPSGQDGLPTMFRKAFRLVGLDDEACRARLAHLLDGYGARELFPAASNLLGLEPNRAPFGSMKFSIIRRLIQAASRDHATVVLLDSIESSEEACEFALDVANTPDRIDGPLLVVAIADSLATTPGLQALRDNPVVARVRVEPLPEHVLADELREELRLDPALAASVARATGGFPEHAVRLVDDLLRKGAIRLTDGVWDGTVDTDSNDVFRSDGHWRQHLLRVAPTRDEKLELGAAVLLGANVERARLRDVCRELRIASSSDLWNQLDRAGLAKIDAESLTVRYEPFRRVVLDELSDRLLLSMVHKAVADALSTDAPGPATLGRIAYHRLHGGSPEDALDLSLRTAALALERRGPLNDVLKEALQVAEHAVELHATPTTEQSRMLQLARAGVARNSGATNRALELTEGLAQADDSIGGRASLIRAAALMQLGELDRARTLMESRIGIGGQPSILSSCHRTQSTIGLRLNAPEMVELHTEQALEYLDPATDPVPVAWCYYRLADLERQRGDLAKAFEHLDLARTYFTNAGFEIGLAETANLEGGLLMTSSRFEQAREQYEIAYDMMRRAGSKWAVTARLNVALAAIFMGEGASIADLVTDLRDELRTRKFELFNTYGLMVECAVVAELGDRERFDVLARDARTRLRQMEEEDEDLWELVDWIHRRWSLHGDALRSIWFDLPTAADADHA